MLIVLMLVAAYVASQAPTPLIIGLAIANIVTLFFLMFVIEDVKTKIIAWRIKRAAVRDGTESTCSKTYSRNIRGWKHTYGR